MWKRSSYDAVVIGSGPNGLSAAIHLARRGLSVLVLEARSTVGGGTRSAELTLPGYTHDVCSAVLPLSLNSPFFATLPLEQFGVEWIQSPTALAHPLDGGKTVLVQRSLEDTARDLGADAQAYRRLYEPLRRNWSSISQDLMGPLPFPPRNPIPFTLFGLHALQPATFMAKRTFASAEGRAVFAGMAAHSIMSLHKPTTSAFGLVTNLMAHTVGWPIVKGGTQKLANALAAYFTSLGGEIVTGCHVVSIHDLPSAKAYLFDTAPHHMARIAGERLPQGYHRQVSRYRYGPGVFKMDFALDGPVPWAAAENATSATLHLGGTLEEIAHSEREIWEGRPAERPFIIASQPSLFDPSRAPHGKHTFWAYCHVPHGSPVDMSAAIEAQIERFAPGFRERILAKHTYTALQMEAYNPNYVGGDINCGVQDIRQMFTRPVVRRFPYTTPARDIYLCSSATPPGGGVHGVNGYFAAELALKRVFRG